MSRHYRLKTARPLPETFIPARVTQRRPGLTAKVDDCMVWRSDALDVPNEQSICADTEDTFGEETTIIDPMSPDETTIVELDLEDPVVALQIVRRHSELFPSSSTNQFYVKLNILTGLAMGLQRIRCERANGVYTLLLDLDVSASPAKES